MFFFLLCVTFFFFITIQSVSMLKIRRACTNTQHTLLYGVWGGVRPYTPITNIIIIITIIVAVYTPNGIKIKNRIYY